MLYIRTDMNPTIATGHVMRCLSIADAAKAAGEETTFLLADTQAAKLLQNHGHHTIILNTQWDMMEKELPILQEIVKSLCIKRILIDSYQVTKQYLKELSALTETVYIDDLNAFSYPVNTLICYANYWRKFEYPSRYPSAALYLGPKYTPLRRAFSNRSPKFIKPVAENLLLMSGGSDPFHLLAGLLESLDISAYKRIDVICGIYHTEFSALQVKYAPFHNVRIHRDVSGMVQYMEQADLAVSAGGTTLYELCACGTPAISYAIADNQLDNVMSFQEQKLIDYAGDLRADPKRVIHNIIRCIEIHQDNPQLRQKKSIEMQKLVDGEGARRIAAVLAM